jgi:hypothetical protein
MREVLRATVQLAVPAAKALRRRLLGPSSLKGLKPYPELWLINMFVSGFTLLRFVDDADWFLKRVDGGGSISS